MFMIKIMNTFSEPKNCKIPEISSIWLLGQILQYNTICRKIWKLLESMKSSLKYKINVTESK